MLVNVLALRNTRSGPLIFKYSFLKAVKRAASSNGGGRAGCSFAMGILVNGNEGTKRVRQEWGIDHVSVDKRFSSAQLGGMAIRLSFGTGEDCE